MAYTPTITGSFKQNGKAFVDVTFSNGSDSVTKQFDVTSLVELKERVKREKGILDQLEVTTISNGPLDLSDVSVPPTQAEIDKQQWLKDWNNLQGANKLIDAGIISASLPAYIALKSSVTTGFKNSYVTLL